MSRPTRVYLAGPEVFLPEVRQVANRKKAICSEHGFEGVFALDATLDLAGVTAREAGCRVSQANETLIRSCQLLIANLTPFRGPSADVGTAYELGFMRGLGRPVFGYSNETTPFTERTVAFADGHRTATGWADRLGMTIEDFQLTDNLMLDGAVLDGESTIICRAVTAADRYTDLGAFEECVRQIADRWRDRDVAL